MYETKKESQRVILAGIDYDERLDIDSSLDELEALAETAGVLVTDRLIQRREKPHPGHYFGQGKLDELKDLMSLHNADAVICDDELSPAQQRNMSQILDCPIIDRTLLILDIFARRAGSAEGKVQVELAQLKYRLSHLSGMGKVLSRLGGGIGTRGPGEKKLESDRRHIRERIYELNDQLREIENHRQVLRRKREREGVPAVSIVGYTNAGKSTLLNAVTSAGVLAEDKLFATLDTTTRRAELPGGSGIMLTDTVGFIQKLPHHLINAFRATLEELQYADILVHVVDASHPERQNQMTVVYETLQKLNCGGKPVLTVFNKMDKEVELPLPSDAIAGKTLAISAETSHGVTDFLQAIEDLLKSFRKKITVLIPYGEGRLVNEIHDNCEVLSEEYREDGIYLEAFAGEEMENRTNCFKISTNKSTSSRVL